MVPLGLPQPAAKIKEKHLPLGPLVVVIRSGQRLCDMFDELPKIGLEPFCVLVRFDHGEPRSSGDTKALKQLDVVWHERWLEILVLEIHVLEMRASRAAFGKLELGWSLSRGWYGLV